MDNQDWFWQYVPDADEWQLYTRNDFTVSVVCRVKYGSEKTIAWYKASGVPRFVKEVLVMLARQLDFLEARAKGVDRIVVHKDQIIQAARNLEQLEVVRYKEAVHGLSN